MNKVLIGKKAGMTRIYNENDESVPVTAIKSPDCVVVRKRSLEGRPSLQLGFRETDSVNKPLQGHFDKHGVSPRKELHEMIVEEDSPLADLEPGDRVKPDIFDVGDIVDVTGESKGRGFQGVVKRWDFSGGPSGHGGRFGRNTGSVGQSADPSRIFPGKKMPGQYGGDTTTMQNLTVMRILPDENAILVSGSVPGADEWTVMVRNAAKEAEAVANT
ncbi:MAG: 50S ribosomal protein L3 [bacterium]